MDSGPGKKSKKPLDRSLAGLEDRKPLTNDRHIALIEVAKRSRCRSICHPSANQVSCVSPLLHRDLCHAGKSLPILIKRRGIADHKNLRMARHCEVALDTHAPSMI